MAKDTKAKPAVAEYLLWNDKPAKVIGETEKRTVKIRMLEDKCCPHCGRSTGTEEFAIDPTTEEFRKSAKNIPSIDLKAIES